MMWQMYEEEMNDALNVYDCVYGKVIDLNQKGVYVRLENGETAFSYFNPLERGTKVLCTVLRKSKGKAYMNVSIDAVYGVDRAEAYPQERAA